MKENRSIDGFIRKLIVNGHEEYAVELKKIITTDINRGYAEWVFSRMRILLLSRILEFICYSDHNRNKVHEEIVLQLSIFDSRNASQNGKPWISIRRITSELNCLLKKSHFWHHCRCLFEDSPEIATVLCTLKASASLSNLQVKLFYSPENNLKISIEGQVL